MHSFRPFNYESETDYTQAVGVVNAVWPLYPDSVQEWRHWDSTRESKYFYHREVIEREGRIIGLCSVGESSWSHKPGKYFVSIDVLPDCQRQGIGSAAYDHALNVLSDRDPAPALLTSNTREDRPGAVRFLEKRGFRQVMRYPRSLLQVADFDPQPYAALLEMVQASGIELITVVELRNSDPEWLQHFYDLTELQIMPDVPLPDPYTPPSLAKFEERFIQHPNFAPEMLFIARDGEQWVGMSGLHKPDVYKGLLHTGLTGVLASHRRRGIATALKVTAITHAQALGAARIETDNEEKNPMYYLNMQLGFEPQPAWIDYHNQLTS